MTNSVPPWEASLMRECRYCQPFGIDGMRCTHDNFCPVEYARGRRYIGGKYVYAHDYPAVRDRSEADFATPEVEAGEETGE